MAVMLAFGMSAYLWAYAPERLRLALSPTVRRLALVASLVALLTAVVWLQLESASMADDWRAGLDPALVGAVLGDTAFGHAWALHLVLAAALVAVILFGPRARWGAAAVVSGALLASLGLVDHAAMQTGAEGFLHRANHALHLLAAGAWLGGLVVFAMCLGAYRRDDLREDAVRAMMGFSFWGQFIVAAVVLTGAVNIALTSGRAPIPPVDPLSRASDRENHRRRDHDRACGFQPLCSRAAAQEERNGACCLERDLRGGSRAGLARRRARQRVRAVRPGVKRRPRALSRLDRLRPELPERTAV